MSMAAYNDISATWRFSSLNYPNFEVFGLVPKSPIHTGLISINLGAKYLRLGAPLSLGPSFMIIIIKNIFNGPETVESTFVRKGK
jgi:hypothetical protein